MGRVWHIHGLESVVARQTGYCRQAYHEVHCPLFAPCAPGWVHPTLNVDNPEDGVDLERVVAGQKQKLDINVALSNSFGFGGEFGFRV